MSERMLWEQQESEPTLWYGRFTSFRLMGTKRSVNAVYAKENKEKQGKTSTKISQTWYEAAKTWEWEKRATAWDAHLTSEEDRIIAEEKHKVLRSGFALMHKRIEMLDELSRKLIMMTEEDKNVWIPETRTAINGEDRSLTIEKVTFNAPLFTLIDKYLDSIAKEVGERQKKQELDVKIRDTTQALYKAIDEALAPYPQIKIALAAKIAEVGKSLDQNE